MYIYIYRVSDSWVHGCRVWDVRVGKIKAGVWFENAPRLYHFARILCSYQNMNAVPGLEVRAILISGYN